MLITDTIVAHQCPSCGVWHGIPERLNQQALDKRGPNGKQIYCPNGHTWHYTGKTEAERLKDQLEQAQREKIWAENRASRIAMERDAAQRQASAFKGQATRARKRAQAALCPVEGCGRSFIQMKRHLSAKHPGYAPQTEEVDPRSVHAHA